MPQVDDLSRSLTPFDQSPSLVVVVEMSEASWLTAGMIPGVDRQLLKKLEPDPDGLLRLLERWRAETVAAGRVIERVTLAYEAGRDGFWLARWLRALVALLNCGFSRTSRAAGSSLRGGVST